MIKYDIRGLENFERLVKSHPKIARKAASLAINRGARRARTEGKREIRRQLNLKNNYIDQHLNVTSYASESRLEAVISGRVRPTSLRRFNATPATRKGRLAGVRVTVKPGRRVLMRRAFLIKLNRGKGTADGFNEGLAVRLKAGESMEGKGKQYGKGDPGLYLLYGPSVDQAFETVRDDIHPGIAREMNLEFNRQFARLLR